jgi:hypothetical protein
MVIDEVVRNPQGFGGDPMGGLIGVPHGMEEMTDIIRSPNMNEAEVRGAEKARRDAANEQESPPHGYNGGYEPLAPKLTMIPPGGQLLFSLPVNHVDRFWHFEVPFRLALPNKGRRRPPYSYVAFYQEDFKDNHADVTTTAPTTH